MSATILPRAGAREAWRNTISGTSRAMLMAIMFTALFGAVAAVGTADLVRVDRQAAAFRDAGGATYVLRAVGAINGTRCDALETMPGVLGAGAARASLRTWRVMAAPQAALNELDTTPGVARVLGIEEPKRSGVILERTAANLLGMRTAAQLETSAGAITLTGVYEYPDDGRAQDFSFAALTAVAPTGHFDACYVNAWPPSADIEASIRTALVPGTPPDQVEFGQLNQSLGPSFDPNSALRERPGAAAPAIAALLGLALGFASAWMRRLELASAMHSRYPKAALTLQVGAETALWVGASWVVVSAGMGVVAHLGTPDPPGAAWVTGALTAAVGALSAIVGAAVAVLLVSERRLLAFFKGR